MESCNVRYNASETCGESQLEIRSYNEHIAIPNQPNSSGEYYKALTKNQVPPERFRCARSAYAIRSVITRYTDCHEKYSSVEYILTRSVI